MEQNESWIKFSNEVLTEVSQTVNSIKQWQTKKKKMDALLWKKYVRKEQGGGLNLVEITV